MSSIYYSARRKIPLSDSEVAYLKTVEEKFNNTEEIRELTASGNGELLSLSPQTVGDEIILEGVLELPDDLFPDDIDDFIYVVETWFSAFSELRNNLPEAKWSVSIDGSQLCWDNVNKKYERPQS